MSRLWIPLLMLLPILCLVARTRARAEAPPLPAALSWESFQDRYRRAPPADRPPLLDAFLAAVHQRTTPLREGSRLIFLYALPAPTATARLGSLRPTPPHAPPSAPSLPSVRIQGDFTGWHKSRPMTRFEGTPLFWTDLADVPADARLEYNYLLDGRPTLDPGNPHTADNGMGGRNCVVEMPHYAPYRFRDAGDQALAPHLARFTFRSTRDRTQRRVVVYTPPQYADHPADRFPTVYVHDGTEYLERARTAALVDDLIRQERLRPLLLVFVDPVDRDREYSCDARFTTCFVDEIVPFIEARFRTVPAPAGRAVMGASLGGLISLYLGATHPDVFGAVAAQSGAFSRNPALLDRMSRTPQVPLRIYADVGRYDLIDRRESLLDANRHLRTVLNAAGYPLRYREFNGGHNWTCWRDQLADLFEFLFPGPAAARP